MLALVLVLCHAFSTTAALPLITRPACVALGSMSLAAAVGSNDMLWVPANLTVTDQTGRASPHPSRGTHQHRPHAVESIPDCCADRARRTSSECLAPSLRVVVL